MKLILFLFPILVMNLYSLQNDEYKTKAMELINEREFEKAHQYLDSIYKITNDDVFKYERAVIYYRQKMFREAIELLETLVVKDDAKIEYYQLLGSCYDFEADKTNAVQVLTEGLFKFPDQGNLYYELGVTKLGMQERQEAADLWEKGIYVDPYYDKNYFQLLKYYRNTDFKIVAMMYGEIFMNISNDDKKKQEVSGIMFDIYKNLFDEYKVSQVLKMSAFARDFKIEDAVEYPFLFKYQEVANQVIKKIDLKGETTIKMINDFRVEFLNAWNEGQNNEFYPTVIFEYQSVLKGRDLIEPYNYLLFSAGNIDEIKSYATSNRDKIIKLVNWQEANRMEINTENKYFSQKFRP